MSSGGGSSPSSTTQTTRTEVPDELKPLVSQQSRTGVGALRNLQSMLGNAGADELIAGFDPLQLQAQEQVLDIAGGGGGFLSMAQDALMSTARGDFLFGGPGFNEAVDAAVRAAQPHIFSAFGGRGSGTGGLAQAAIGRQATDAFANQYQAERQRQLAAAGALPQLALLAPDLLQQVGGQRQQMAQRQLTAPITAQEALLQASGGGVPLGALLGSTATGQQAYSSNPAAGALGGGLAGLGIGAATAAEGATGLAALGGPWGLALAGGGALLGGLLS